MQNFVCCCQVRNNITDITHRGIKNVKIEFVQYNLFQQFFDGIFHVCISWIAFNSDQRKKKGISHMEFIHQPDLFICVLFFRFVGVIV